MLAGGEIAQRVGARAEIIVGVGQVGLGADDADLELTGAPTLANARIENGGFLARVRAHDQQRVGLFDAGNGRVEDIGGAPRLRIEGVAALHRQIGRTAFRQQFLQREHLFDRGNVAGDRADPFAVDAAGLGCDRGEGFLPGGGAELAVFPDVGAIQPLRAQPVDDVAGLVGDPLFVHRLVDARQDPHHFATTGIDPDRRAHAIHHVDRLGLAELPRPRRERVGLRGQRADRADIDQIALQFGTQRGFEIGRDFHILATAGRAHFGGAGNFGGEANAARALDAAVHRGLDQRTQIFVFDGALVLGETAGVDTIAHRLVLQIALAALIADRAIQRMVDQQKFHHAFACLLDHRRAGRDFRRLTLGTGTAIANAPGAACDRLRAALHLDQAHPAIAGDRQPLMVAKPRNFGARRFARLQQRVFRGNIDLFAIDDEFGHCDL